MCELVPGAENELRVEAVRRNLAAVESGGNNGPNPRVPWGAIAGPNSPDDINCNMAHSLSPSYLLHPFRPSFVVCDRGDPGFLRAGRRGI